MKPIQLASVCFILFCNAMTAAAQQPSDFTSTTNNGAITIIGYSGSAPSITIPGSIDGMPVTEIGSNALALHWFLTSVTIPSSVTNIMEFAFGGCTSLTNFNIPNGVTTIGPYAFASCWDLRSVTIPDSVTSIGDYAFSLCSNVTQITVAPSNTFYSSVDGVLFNKDKTELLQYPIGKVGGYSIPPSVVTIANGAFHATVNLTSVLIPKSVTNIENYDFDECWSLTNILVQGNAPRIGSVSFFGESSYPPCTLYYLPGTTGWGSVSAMPIPQLWNPVATAPRIQGKELTFAISGTPDIRVAIEASTNLTMGTWVALQTASLTNGVLHFVDSQWTNYWSRFYRIRSP
jgi:hypothetical protein